MMWPTHSIKSRLTRSCLKEASDALRTAVDLLVEIEDPDNVLRPTLIGLLGIESRVYDLYRDHILPDPDDEA